MTFEPLRFALPLVLAASIFAPTARAESSAEPPVPAPIATSQWYGWETLLVDGAALTTLVASGVRTNNALAPIGYGLYVLGPSAVHVAHGRLGAGLGDAAMRVVLPIAIGALGYAIDYSTSSCSQNDFICWRGLGGAALGGIIGYASAVALDAAWLAREPAVRMPEKTTGVRWTPALQLNQGGASGGVAGMF